MYVWFWCGKITDLYYSFTTNSFNTFRWCWHLFKLSVCVAVSSSSQMTGCVALVCLPTQCIGIRHLMSRAFIIFCYSTLLPSPFISVMLVACSSVLFQSQERVLPRNRLWLPRVEKAVLLVHWSIPYNMDLRGGGFSILVYDVVNWENQILDPIIYFIFVAVYCMQKLLTIVTPPHPN